MNIDESGLDLIKGFEGLELHAYQDKAGVWTIGYGCTWYPNGNRVHTGDSLPDYEAAENLLKANLVTFEKAVNYNVRVKLTQNQFNALVSFTYNEGIEALKSSTMLKELNEGNYAEAAEWLLVWNKITNPKTGLHEVCDDLVVRRRKERQVFLTP